MLGHGALGQFSLGQGKEVSAVYTLAAGTATFSWAGVNASLNHYAVSGAVSAGSFTLSSVGARVGWGKSGTVVGGQLYEQWIWGGTLTTIEFNPAPATYSWAGVSATVKHHRKLSPAPGSFTTLKASGFGGLGALGQLALGQSAAITSDFTAQLNKFVGFTAAPGAFALGAKTVTFNHIRNGLSAATGTFAWTGVNATMSRSTATIAAATGAFAIAGVATPLKVSHKIYPAAAAFSLAGVPAGLQQVLGAATRTFAWTGVNTGSLKYLHKIYPAAGAFALAPQTITPLWKHKMTAVVGAFTLTKNNSHGVRTMSPPAFAFTLSKKTVTFKWSHKLYPQMGTAVQFLLAPKTALLNHIITPLRKLQTSAGAFVLTGHVATLKKGYTLLPSIGGYTWAPNNGQMRQLSFGMFTGVGTYAVDPQTISFKFNHVYYPAAGAFVIAGAAGSLQKHVISPAVGGFVMAGVATPLQVKRVITCNAGAFAISGSNATLAHSNHGAVSTGAFTWTGYDATMSKPHNLGVQAAAFTLGPGTIGFVRAYQMSPPVVAFLWDGSPITTTKWLRMYPAAGSFDVTAPAANMLHQIILGVIAINTQFVITGQMVSSIRKSIYSVGFGTIVWQGVNTAQMIRTRLIAAAPGAFAVDGTVGAQMVRSRIANVGTGAFLVAPGVLTMGKVSEVVAAPAAFVLASVGAALSRPRALPAEPGAFKLQGVGASLTVPIRTLTPGLGLFTLTGYPSSQLETPGVATIWWDTVAKPAIVWDKQGTFVGDISETAVSNVTWGTG
jgi:hypothetical protein